MSPLQGNSVLIRCSKRHVHPWAAALVLCAIVLWRSSPDAHAQDTLVRTYTFPAPRVDVSGRYAVVTMGDLPLLGQAGEPALPYKPLRVLIPRGTEATSVEFDEGGKVTLPGRYLVAPAEKPVPLSYRGAPIATIPANAIYASFSPYPPALLSAVTVQEKGPYTLLLLNLNHVTFIPAQGELSYYPRITVTVTLKPSPAPRRSRASQGYRLQEEESLRGKVENPEALASYVDAKTENGLSAALESYPHVIITSQALANAAAPWNFQALRDHRAARGMPSTIVTTEYIYANFSGTKPNGQSDNQTRIRNFVTWAHDNWGTRYVLLGGNSGIIPVRYLQADGENIPADMYYGNLNGTFDNDADGVYGEPADGPNGGEVDLYAEVYIGRACVENAAEVANFVRKTVEYETSTAAYLHSARMVWEYLGF